MPWNEGSFAAFLAKVNVWEQPAQALSAPISASSNSAVPVFSAKTASKTCCCSGARESPQGEGFQAASQFGQRSA